MAELRPERTLECAGTKELKCGRRCLRRLQSEVAMKVLKVVRACDSIIFIYSIVGHGGGANVSLINKNKKGQFIGRHRI